MMKDIFLEFKTVKDREEVMMKGPYTFWNMPMVVLDWRPDFSIERDMLRTIPIWKKLPPLPFKMWNPKSMAELRGP